MSNIVARSLVASNSAADCHLFHFHCAAVALALVTAFVVVSMPKPETAAGAANGPSAVTRSALTEITGVNRINKGDQLVPALVQQVQQNPSLAVEGAKASLQRPRLGCDGAFSPVADPARAAIYKRCTV